MHGLDAAVKMGDEQGAAQQVKVFAALPVILIQQQGQVPVEGPGHAQFLDAAHGQVAVRLALATLGKQVGDEAQQALDVRWPVPCFHAGCYQPLVDGVFVES
jgi:hypothetical protein